MVACIVKLRTVIPAVSFMPRLLQPLEGLINSGQLD